MTRQSRDGKTLVLALPVIYRRQKWSLWSATHSCQAGVMPSSVMGSAGLRGQVEKIIIHLTFMFLVRFTNHLLWAPYNGMARLCVTEHARMDQTSETEQFALLGNPAYFIWVHVHARFDESIEWGLHGLLAHAACFREGHRCARARVYPVWHPESNVPSIHLLLTAPLVVFFCHRHHGCLRWRQSRQSPTGTKTNFTTSTVLTWILKMYYTGVTCQVHGIIPFLATMFSFFELSTGN